MSKNCNDRNCPFCHDTINRMLADTFDEAVQNLAARKLHIGKPTPENLQLIESLFVNYTSGSNPSPELLKAVRRMLTESGVDNNLVSDDELLDTINAINRQKLLERARDDLAMISKELV